MGKKHKKQRKHNNVEIPREVSTISLKKILSKNFLFIMLLIVLCVTLYANSINNQLTLVDDIQGFVYDERIQDLSGTVKGFILQRIGYAISYNFFGHNPMPLRVIAVSLHAVTTVLVFIFLYLLYNRKIAVVASLVFAVHAINTEAVTWISGSPYIYIGLFNFLIFIPFVLYKKTQKLGYLYASAALYIAQIVFVRAPWVLVVPLALVVLDQFFYSKKFDVSKLWWVILFVIPISFYLVTNFSSMYQSRQTYRSGNGNRVTLHTQSFKPVIQGYPYTTYLMSKLYLFPKDLSVYYDGMEVTTGLYFSMYLSFFAYVGLTIYLWKKKHRDMAGIMLMLPILIGPTYSPVKVTWFLAERYLYSGTAFYGVLVAKFFLYLKEKYSNKIISYGFLGLLLGLLSFRTFTRNEDWYDTESLSKANMKVAPLSVRPYNDLGGHYYYQGRIDEAVAMYEKALTVVESSGTAINNLGFIYLEYGPLILRDDFVVPEQNKDLAEKYYNYARRLSREGGEIRTISYFMNKALALNIESVDYTIAAADLYREIKFLDIANKLYEKALALDPENEIARSRMLVISNQ